MSEAKESNEIIGKDAFVRYLESEIESSQGDFRKSGFTKWAIVVAISTILWIFIETIIDKSYQIKNVFLIVLIISLAGYTFSLVKSLIFTEVAHNNEGRYFNFKTVLEEKRASTILSLLYAAFIFYLIVFFKNDVSLISFIVAIISIILVLLIYLQVFVMSFVEYPLSEQKKTKAFYILIIIYILCIAYALFGYSMKIFLIKVSVADARLAGMIVALYILLKIYESISHKSPVSESLLSIKRNLVLGKISLESAISKTEVVILGNRFSEHLQDILKAMLDISEMFDKEYDSFLFNLDKIEAMIKNEENLSSEKRCELFGILQILEASMDKVREYLKQIESKKNYISLWLLRNPNYENAMMDSKELNESILKIAESSKENIRKAKKQLKTISEAKCITNLKDTMEPPC